MTERVDRFTPYLHEDWRGMIGVTASMRSTANGEYVRVEVYQSQAERIAQLEAENAILRTEKHADAEAIASARNNALREAAQIVGRYDEESTCPSCCDVTAINEEITALTVTPQEAAKVSAEDRENIVDEIESIICETHEMDVRDIDYAENIVSWLERHHPAALRAISEDSQ